MRRDNDGRQMSRRCGASGTVKPKPQNQEGLASAGGWKRINFNMLFYSPWSRMAKLSGPELPLPREMLVR